MKSKKQKKSSIFLQNIIRFIKLYQSLTTVQKYCMVKTKNFRNKRKRMMKKSHRKMKNFRLSKTVKH